MGGNLGFLQGFWVDWWSKNLVNKLFCGCADTKAVGQLSSQVAKLTLSLPQGEREGARKRYAFTLAEVLITLGIIGVVAAVTLPSVVQHYKQKILETSFKKSYANFYNAYNKAMLNDPPLWDDENTTNYYPELAKAIYAEYKTVRNTNGKDSYTYKNEVKTYTKEKAVLPECSQLIRNTGSVITPDGSMICVSQNCETNWVTIDTNGIKKGPNAYGHDIFLFTISKTGKFEPAVSESEGAYDENGNRLPGYNNTKANKNKCSKNATSKLNGILCAEFALANRCPDDPSKTYWECLR